MKRDAIRAEVAATLKQLGFTSKQYRWMGCELHIIIGREFRTLRLPAGMARRDLARHLGRLEGWVQVLSEISSHVRSLQKRGPVASGPAAAHAQ